MLRYRHVFLSIVLFSFLFLSFFLSSFFSFFLSFFLSFFQIEKNNNNFVQIDINLSLHACEGTVIVIVLT